MMCHSTVGELSADVRAAILLQSKAFDPKTFLATIHPSATPDDLRRGRDRLRGKDLTGWCTSEVAPLTDEFTWRD